MSTSLAEIKLVSGWEVRLSLLSNLKGKYLW